MSNDISLNWVLEANRLKVQSLFSSNIITGVSAASVAGKVWVIECIMNLLFKEILKL